MLHWSEMLRASLFHEVALLDDRCMLLVGAPSCATKQNLAYYSPMQKHLWTSLQSLVDSLQLNGGAASSALQLLQFLICFWARRQRAARSPGVVICSQQGCTMSVSAHTHPQAEPLTGAFWPCSFTARVKSLVSGCPSALGSAAPA